MSAMDEGTALRSRTRAALWRLAGPWWMFLLTGIAWLLVTDHVTCDIDGVPARAR